MTGTTRIRWEPTDYGYVGYVGTLESWLFTIYKPCRPGDRWMVTSEVPGSRDADSREGAMAAAERWLSGFIVSLGAVFPVHIRNKDLRVPLDDSALAGKAAAAVIPIPWDSLQENLVTQAEIARRVGLTKTALTAWQQYEDWPLPVMTFDAHSSTGESRFHWWPDIQAWCNRHGVVSGRGMERGRKRGRARPASDRDRRIAVRARAGEHHEAIAAEFGISRQRVSQIARALAGKEGGDGMEDRPGS